MVSRPLAPGYWVIGRHVLLRDGTCRCVDVPLFSPGGGVSMQERHVSDTGQRDEERDGTVQVP